MTGKTSEGGRACPRPSFRFRRADRIPEGEDFVRTVRSGASLALEHVRVLFRPNGLGRSRLGISVARRVGKAVTRNRLKRIVREAFRTCPEVRAAGLDLVVIVRDAGLLDRPEEAARALRKAALGRE